MTTTAAEKELLTSIQTLRVTSYERYSEILKACTAWVNSEVNRLSPKTEKEGKIISINR